MTKQIVAIALLSTHEHEYMCIMSRMLKHSNEHYACEVLHHVYVS